MFDELRWLLGLNLVISIWLGMFADSWKGRRMYVWMAIGLVTSVAGLVALAFLPKIQADGSNARAKAPARYNPNNTTDSYGH